MAGNMLLPKMKDSRMVHLGLWAIEQRRNSLKVSLITFIIITY